MPPPADRLCWAAVGVGAGGLGWGLLRYWTAEPDSADRGLILLAAGWAGYHLWPPAAGRPRPWLGLLLVLLGAVAFLPGWFVHLQAGPRSLLLWWEASALLLAAAGLLLMRRGFLAVRVLRFPLLFPLLALPVPTRVLGPVQAVLQECTTTLAAAVMPLVGLDVKRDGFVLHLPTGPLGVVEACSGVRSVTALLAVAVFLAFLRGFGVLRGLLAVLLSVPVIVLVNALRVTAFGLMQEHLGRDWVVGWRHDAVGFAAVLVGVAVIAGLVRRLAPGSPPDWPPPNPVEPPAPRQLVPAAAVLALATACGGGLLFLPGLARSAAEPPPLTDLPAGFDGWAGKEEKIDPEVLAQLGCDRASFRTYTDRLGNEVQVWVLYWATATGVRGYHHPDVCWPNRGFTLAEKRDEELSTPGGRTVPLTYREFAHGRQRQAVVYWTQEGRRFWTAADERAALTGLTLAPLRWTMSRLAEPAAPGADDRLVVLAGTSAVGPPEPAAKRVRAVAGGVADRVYGMCPWADPGR